jgi:hypothetical protein
MSSSSRYPVEHPQRAAKLVVNQGESQNSLLGVLSGRPRNLPQRGITYRRPDARFALRRSMTVSPPS